MVRAPALLGLCHMADATARCDLCTTCSQNQTYLVLHWYVLCNQSNSVTFAVQVAPVIAVSGTVITPREGETFDGPSNPATRQELAALFAVVGTPPWCVLWVGHWGLVTDMCIGFVSP